ncbi:hypothetical protein Ccar_12490 [Clostridium carboxidivorans P7]|uniref:Uncharacterized protein n=1 Tax=Clostridium carboxidivorans P7 TaxID=536227 RepID=C6PSR1_9CLOT|nr:hypothetical protein [Clostridium carboxidivorans]AKN31637.1 hypothetical protein Ccar_12490 [Clostridium carboxidivorans P7]EET87740.1 hypothetical protein CcarbDRAFT_1828 [Clostridium carboxidivorans P7]
MAEKPKSFEEFYFCVKDDVLILILQMIMQIHIKTIVLTIMIILLKKYVDPLSYNDMQDKLNSIMNMLCRKHNKKAVRAKNSNSSIKSKNTLLIHETTLIF